MVMGTLDLIGGSKSPKGSKGGGGTLAMLGGGSSGGRGGLEGKKRELENATTKARETGDGGLLDAVKGIASGAAKAGGSLVGDALNVLDLPRSAVVSTIQEAGDFTSGKGFSIEDWVSQIQDHIGVGDVLENSDGDFFGIPIDNKWVKRTLGFVGDVALDPLTYASFGATAVAKGAKGGSKVLRLSNKDVARRATTQGMDEAAERVLAKGAGALTRSEADRLGIKVGPSIGLGNKRVGLHGGPTTRGLAEAGGVAKKAVHKVPGMDSLLAKFDEVPGLTALRAGGQRTEALKLADVVARAAGRARGLSDELERELATLAKRHKSVDPDLLRRAMEGDSAARAAARGAWGDMADWFETARTRAEAATGRAIPALQDYLPHNLSEAFRDHLAKNGKRLGRTSRKVSLELQRAYKAGDKFLGEELKRGTIDELHDIAQRVIGPDYVQIFQTNPWEIAHGYVRQVERFTQRHGIAAGAVERGLVRQEGESVGRKLRSKVTAQREAARAARELADQSTVTKSAPDFDQAAVVARAAPADDVAQIERLETLAASPSAPDGALASAADLDEDVIDEMLRDGLREFSEGRWADPRVADALLEIEQNLTPEKVGKLLRFHDNLLSRWKAYALLTPGFHIRNSMGGVFNNALAGMDNRWYAKYDIAARQFRRNGLDGIKDRQVRDAWEAMMAHGVLDDTHVRDLADVTGDATGRGLLGRSTRAQTLDPTSLNNAALKLNRKMAVGVERHLRGPLFLESYIATGGNLDEALARVAKFHFDYTALSAFERKWMRRAFPFYTWTRKNLPLQLEQMARNPGAYTKYLHAKRNLESGVPEDDVVPAYYSDLLAIRSPFKSKGGDRIYLTPDLPFRDLAETFDVTRAAGQLSPLLKVPLELDRGRSFYSDLPLDERAKPAPDIWVPILMTLEPFKGKFGLPKVKRHTDGNWMISERDAYKIEQSLPLLGRLRRVAPSEERFQSRRLTTYLSIFAGVGSRTLDDGQVYGELARRVDEVNKLLKDWHERNDPLAP